MNQILYTGNDNNKKRDKDSNSFDSFDNFDSYSSDNSYKTSKTTSSKDMKKILKVFGVVLLIFGICLAGFYGYRMLNKDKEGEPGAPSASLKYEEGNSEIVITARAEAGISKIIYYWNDEEPEEIDGNNRTEEQIPITIKKGDNTLTVKIIDKNGKEETTTETYHYMEDNEAPEIVVVNDKESGEATITATDDTEIAYITYRINDEEEIRVDAEEDGQLVIEVIVDLSNLSRGDNTITIKAVDIYGNTDTYTEQYKGINKPIIEVTKRDGQIHMKITHDMGFEKVEFIVNGKEYIYDENYSGYDKDETELEYYFDMQEGENTVIIHAISLEGKESEETKKFRDYYEAPEIPDDLET